MPPPAKRKRHIDSHQFKTSDKTQSTQINTLFESFPGITAAFNQSGELICSNQGFRELPSICLNEKKVILKKDIRPFCQETLLLTAKRIFSTAQPETFEMGQESPLIWYRCVATKIYLSDQNREIVTIICTDLTEQKAQEKQLKHSNQKLQQDLDRFHQIIETTEEGIWTISPKRKTTFVNDRMAEMLGYLPEEMIGKDLFEFMDKQQQTIAEKNMKRRRKGIRETHDFIFRKKDLTRIWVSLSTNPLYDPLGHFMGALAMVTDISTRIKTESLLSVQRSIFELLVRGDSLRKALNTLVLAIEKIVDGMIASVLILDPKTNQLSTQAAPNLPTSYSETIDHFEIGPKAGSCGAAAYLQKLVIVSDIDSDPLWEDYKTLAKKYNLRACWSNPILSRQGKVLGTFAMYFKDTRKPNEFELQLVKDATTAAALIIEYAQTFESLEKSNSLLRSALESTADGIIVVNHAGEIQTSNEKFAKLWNIPKDILFSEPLRRREFLYKQVKNPEKFIKKVEYLYSHPSADSLDILEMNDGRILERYSAPQYQGNQIVGRVWSFRDVTVRFRNEIELKESEERFRALSQATFEGVTIIRDGLILLVNESLPKLYGYEANEMIGRSAFEFTSPESIENLKKQIATKSEGPYEGVGLRKDGSTFWGEVRAKNILYKGVPARVTSVRDITERKVAEEKLRRNEEEFRATFELAAVGKAQIHPYKGVFTRVNRKLCQIIGYPMDELIGKHFSTFLFPDDRAIAENSFQKLIHEEIQEYSGERRWVRKDGKMIWITATVAPIVDSQKNIINSIVEVQDITERKNTENERNRLLQNEKKAREQATFLANANKILGSSIDYEITLKNISQLLIDSKMADWCILGLTKEDGTIQAVAVAAEPSKATLIRQLESYRPDMNASEGLPKAIRTGSPLLYAEVKVEQLFPESLNSPIVGTRNSVYLKTMRDLGLTSYMAVPMFIRDKVVGGILIMSAKAERSYSESDLKLAVELARSCATSIDNASLYREAQQSIQVRDDFILIASHELRTPLTPLKLQLQLMKRSFHPSKNQSPLNSASFEKLLTDSERQAEHLIMLVENLLDTSKISTGSLKLSLELGDLNALVSQTLHRLATDLEKSHCMLSFTSNLNAYGHWDNDRIQQVITILLLNAMKYGQGKPIEIKIFQENSNAVLTVTDHGIGIDQKDQAKLFRRFERVAPVTAFGGLGLGLFIAQQIIEKHGGKISVTSQPGLGSTFRVALPLHKKDSL